MARQFNSGSDLIKQVASTPRRSGADGVRVVGNEAKAPGRTGSKRSRDETQATFAITHPGIPLRADGCPDVCGLWGCQLSRLHSGICKPAVASTIRLSAWRKAREEQQRQKELLKRLREKEHSDDDDEVEFVGQRSRADKGRTSLAAKVGLIKNEFGLDQKMPMHQVLSAAEAELGFQACDEQSMLHRVEQVLKAAGL
jgi:hypothetical protein